MSLIALILTFLASLLPTPAAGPPKLVELEAGVVAACAEDVAAGTYPINRRFVLRSC